ncbi:YkgJ family cysteine cluster protein [Aquabacterium sp. CECT 9606]|uniref:YkgJ family cysteine cluster protein n=1 Tax=Aquabacterium sp. CECT 9606 TaxID=2845822 RepID=UPI001E61360D|nr:YkgJ family cysteine cluster protein [Aquabacterium sp. CECT 9606]CAH0351925.1 hypothetical protein AQB9606_02514 [Aquabacterium sp. CECT 9606]
MSEERMLEHARPEFAQAWQDLQSNTVREAVVRFYARHDARVNTAIQAAPQALACDKGCSHCCRQFDVVALPVEVFEIHAHVFRHFKPDQLRDTIQRVIKYVAKRKGVSEETRLSLRDACPFLVDNSCSIYPVRPSVCRNYHATDKTNCEKSLNEPLSTWPTTYIDDVFFTAMGSSAGFRNAVAEMGLDTKEYHLSAAFLETVQNPNCVKRFKSGKNAFVKATHTQFNQSSGGASRAA